MLLYHYNVYCDIRDNLREVLIIENKSSTTFTKGIQLELNGRNLLFKFK